MKALASALAFLVMASAGAASAAGKHRHFEPDDLELERPGILDLDLQAGPMRGHSALGNHLVLPDFEVGLGLTRDVELDVSSAFTLDGQRHLSGEALWVAAKLGLLDARDAHGTAWAVGLELGPRFPTFDAAGIGYGALALIGFTRRGVALVLNAGSLIDPGVTLSEEHPSSLVVGLDLNAQLDARGTWSLQSELGGAHYLSSDPAELACALGATYAVNPKLDVSLTALSGFLRHGDRAGVLLGVSPQTALW